MVKIYHVYNQEKELIAQRNTFATVIHSAYALAAAPNMQILLSWAVGKVWHCQRSAKQPALTY